MRHGRRDRLAFRHEARVDDRPGELHRGELGTVVVGLLLEEITCRVDLRKVRVERERGYRDESNDPSPREPQPRPKLYCDHEQEERSHVRRTGSLPVVDSPRPKPISNR